jgi:hypothetical protein
MGGATFELMQGASVRVLVEPGTPTEQAVDMLRKIANWIKTDGIGFGSDLDPSFDLSIRINPPSAGYVHCAICADCIVVGAGPELFLSDVGLVCRPCGKRYAPDLARCLPAPQPQPVANWHSLRLVSNDDELPF